MRKLTIITGPVASGKTTRARELEEQGAKVYDEAHNLFQVRRDGVLVLLGDWEVVHEEMEG